ncbi:coenzyme F420-reducing hydrogenase beta subunit [Ruminiclostridium sufflavum DSM 19573]|uniref:Coenzyme F420-reducing hydrogenase beta subunit n=1 Tax=Ruminiclostridium sufflavum DSM 19573 TaxID=1121337 RepID=A0A318XP01_9FIRM|nr:Coenzyme F420 hydrogenase/dehydrogenase, beta subunit C-terminal domain [Ruminiclostridium sufflavum]PYG87798.1 coenzyme F420-reducing hydrogenase beta subunit [Ruminiclostridium sufflavum DSM 19573]
MYKSYLETYSKSDCCGCSACSLACPVSAITMAEDSEGFLYPRVNNDKCINCSICIKKCCLSSSGLRFREAGASETQNNNSNCYAVKNNDEKLRRLSSSGGFFPALAKYIILENGFVAGAAYDDKSMVHHIIISSIEEIPLLQGSKYVASRLDNIYERIKSLLEEKRLVLFTGTPCQIAGLLNYLGKKYESLITADLICHGTPSPVIYHDYLRFIENKYHDKIKSVTFRDKVNGWHTENITISMNSNKYTYTWERDPFYTLFFKNYILRPSCYQCRFARHERISDITMADFWGIEKSKPHFDDNKGTSLVITNTQKGQELFDKIKAAFVFDNAAINDSKQPMLKHPAVMPKNRPDFFKSYVNKGLVFCLKKYADYNLRAEIKYRIKKGIKKILNLLRNIKTICRGIKKI